MENTITLQQGLDKFYQRNQKYFSDRTISPEGEAFLKCHDIAHIVFGCDTTIYGEGVVKVWTTFGTTLSFWKVISGYNEANAFELFRMYSVQHVLKNILRFLWAIPKVIVSAKRMNKPWPFADYEAYLQKPITEIRKEFNIQVV
ncbi:MAG: Coq4 family protein [Bacteroidota bacterium]